MIDYLIGIIKNKKEDYVVLSVNDIGYKIKMSLNCIQSLPNIGEKTRILTFLYVRENIIDLYGFKNKIERETFYLLININGIGPKLALTILSGLELGDLKHYVIDGDVKSLTSISGVGSKTAKRIIIELKDKFINLESDALGIKDDLENKSELFNNVVNALVNLGYKPSQSKFACKMLLEKGELKGNIELIIKRALVYLMS